MHGQTDTEEFWSWNVVLAHLKLMHLVHIISSAI